MSLATEYVLSSDIDWKIDQFLRSVAVSFVDPADIYPEQRVEREAEDYRQASALLKEALRDAPLEDSEVAQLIEAEPRIISIAELVLGLSNQTVFADGRIFKIPDLDGPPTIELARLLREMGFWEVVNNSLAVDPVIRVGIVAKVAKRRLIEANARHDRRLRDLIKDSLDDAAREIGGELTVARNALGKRGLTTVAFDGQTVAAIDNVFISSSGGRQSSEFSYLYPKLQADLSAMPAQLILIADGAGVHRVPRRVLQEAFQSIYCVMSFAQATEGYLEAAVVQARRARPRTLPVDRIIESLLDAGETVRLANLPLDPDEARLALARYKNSYSELAVNLGGSGDSLEWNRKAGVLAALRLQKKFSKKGSISAFLDALEAPPETQIQQDRSLGAWSVVEGIASPLLPERFLVVSTDEEESADLIRMVARQSLQKIPDSNICVLLLPDRPSTDRSKYRALQRSLSANVVIVDTSTLLTWMKSIVAPRRSFLQQVLLQSDLTKISPFVVNNVTPERMYYGRQNEEATILGTLATNSVALLGSRRIGKTSLLRHVEKSLIEADFAVHFLDCQTVADWRQFGELAARFWDVSIPSAFRPDHLFDVIEQLAARTKSKIAILLDEIDQLLVWDEAHESENVREAFFRTCRTISQAGKAQFVFSGERKIATKLWDSHSPHWNFCRPLPLRQLEQRSLQRLLTEPFSAMQVSLVPEADILDRAWFATGGHPQIAQFLGDQIVQLLNSRPPETRFFVTEEDVDGIIESFEFKEHYLTTYWGQATLLEKAISLLVVKAPRRPSEILAAFGNKHITQDELMNSIRMLELYGIVSQSGEYVSLEAVWFHSALQAFGGVEQSLQRILEQLQ